MNIRRSHERGYASHGWLNSYHSFSFGHYYDETYLQYSVLRVINEDVIAGGSGFGMHPHRNMEIITYVIDGALRHQDSMGNQSIIKAGDVQKMTAGKGIKHSELNADSHAPVHLLQIWIEPSESGLAPSYAEKHFTDKEKENQWCLIVSPDGRGASLKIHQHALLYASKLKTACSLTYAVKVQRCVYLQVISGRIQLAQQWLEQGDALMTSSTEVLSLLAEEDAEILLFDLPKPSN